MINLLAYSSYFPSYTCLGCTLVTFVQLPTVSNLMRMCRSP